ncbi:MAG: DUF507 family protein [Candidatus Tectomicrobia bacterium]|nr:DUF507 family protein [Candidatus Tectomicrobia bacterium]
MFVSLSREKINHLSKLLVGDLEATEGVVLVKPSNDVRLRIVRVITEEVRLEETIDEEVTRTVLSYGRKIPEGSPEWDVLYRKHYEQELIRRGLK